MTRTSRIVLCSLALALVVSVPVQAGEMVDNPLYKHWAQFKPGSFATVKMTQKVMGNTTETVTTTTLKSITAEKAVLEMKSVIKTGGQEIKSPPQTMDIKAKYEKVELPKEKEEKKAEEPKTKTKSGEEKLDVEGKKVSTKWVEATYEANKVKTYTKNWTCDEIPGQTVKSITKTEGEMKMTMEMVLVKYKAIKK